MQVDIFLLFGFIIMRKDKVLPTSPIGTNTGIQHLAIIVAILNIIILLTSSIKIFIVAVSVDSVELEKNIILLDDEPSMILVF